MSGKPEIQRVDPDVQDLPGGRMVVHGRLFAGATEARVGTTVATILSEAMAGTARFDGTNDRLITALTRTNVLGTAGWSFSCLVKPQDLIGDGGFGGNWTIFTETGQYEVLEVYSGTARLGQYNTAGNVLTSVTASGVKNGQWNRIDARWTGTAIEVRVNEGDWASAAQSEIGGNGTYKFGSNFNTTGAWFKGEMAYLLFAATPLHTADFNDIASYACERYGIFTGYARSDFDPATLPLSLWLEGGDYVSGTWAGTASAGASSGRDLTEATNPPAVADSTILICTAPAKSAALGASAYPVSVKTPTGYGCLAKAVEYGNAGVISDCVWWIRPDDADVDVNGSNEVTDWRDRSGFGDVNRHLTPGIAAAPFWASVDELYGNRPTVGPFDNGSTNAQVRTGVWSTTYSTYSIGVIGHGKSTGNRYFTYESAAQYNALVNSTNDCRVYSTDSTPTISAAGLATMTRPRSHMLAIFNGASSVLYGDGASATGDLDAHVLATIAVKVGSFGNGSAGNGSRTVAEVYAYSRALTRREDRTLRRYRDAYYGPPGITTYDGPTDENLGAYVVEPNYDDTGTPQWNATVGDDLVALGAPTAVATSPGGADYEGDSNWGSAGSTTALSTWAGGTTAEFTLFGVVHLESIVSDVATIYNNHMICADTANFAGLFLRDDTANSRYVLYMYAWDSATRLATLDITALVGGYGVGTGYLIVQGKKEGGVLYARACGATGEGTWTSGDAIGTLGGGAGFFTVGGSAWTVDGVVRAAGCVKGARTADRAAAYERWAQREHPP